MFQLIACLLALSTAEATPVQLTHQARLLDAAGGPLNGQMEVTVSLYDAAVNGQDLWTGTFSDVRIDNGYVSLVLGGDDNPLDHSLLDGDRWVGLTVDTVGTLTPRQPVGSSPRAAIAIEAYHAVTADLASHATTADEAVLAELAAEAEHATTADLAEEALHAAAADEAIIADLAAEADHAATADFATSAGNANTADSANSATVAETAGNASTIGGVSLSGLGLPGTYNISYGTCAWTPCGDTPHTAVCPNGRVMTRIELPEFGGDQSTCGNEDDYRVYCCQVRITVPSAN